MVKDFMDLIKKHWAKIFVAIAVLGLSIVLWVCGGFLTFLSTIVAGLVIGLCSSFAITYLFENEKKQNRRSIRELCIDRFVKSCVDYLVALEMWYAGFTKTKYRIIDNPDVMLGLLDTLRNNYKDASATTIDTIYKTLVNEYTYSISPVYYSYKSLDNQQLLLNDVLSLDEYKFFHNFIRSDMFADFLAVHQKDRFAQATSGYYVFHHLRVCLNCVLDAVKVFPEIEEQYIQRTNQLEK